MTIVVFRDGIMASDSQLAGGGILEPWDTPKLFFGVRHPVLYGVAGDYASSLACLRRLERTAKAPWDGGSVDPAERLAPGSALMVVHLDGRGIFLENPSWYQSAKAPFLVMGSGAGIALGALHMGATAAEAVNAAKRFDTRCGGETVTMHLSDRVPRSRRSTK